MVAVGHGEYWQRVQQTSKRGERGGCGKNQKSGTRGDLINPISPKHSLPQLTTSLDHPNALVNSLTRHVLRPMSSSLSTLTPLFIALGLLAYVPYSALERDRVETLTTC